jgi:hypothetical protein
MHQVPLLLTSNNKVTMSPQHCGINKWFCGNGTGSLLMVGQHSHDLRDHAHCCYVDIYLYQHQSKLQLYCDTSTPQHSCKAG